SHGCGPWRGLAGAARKTNPARRSPAAPVAASNPPPVTSTGRESWLEIRGNPHPEFARKSLPEPRFPANPIAGNPPIFLTDQPLRNISRSTRYLKQQGAFVALPPCRGRLRGV